MDINSVFGVSNSGKIKDENKHRFSHFPTSSQQPIRAKLFLKPNNSKRLSITERSTKIYQNPKNSKKKKTNRIKNLARSSKRLRYKIREIVKSIKPKTKCDRDREKEIAPSQWRKSVKCEI